MKNKNNEYGKKLMYFFRHYDSDLCCGILSKYSHITPSLMMHSQCALIESCDQDTFCDWQGYVIVSVGDHKLLFLYSTNEGRIRLAPQN